jgi:hypothetical protein
MQPPRMWRRRYMYTVISEKPASFIGNVGTLRNTVMGISLPHLEM